MYSVDDIKRSAQKDDRAREECKTALVVFKELPRDFLDYFNDGEFCTNARNLWARFVIWFLAISQFKWCLYLATVYSIFTSRGLIFFTYTFFVLLAGSYVSKWLVSVLVWGARGTMLAVELMQKEVQIK